MGKTLIALAIDEWTEAMGTDSETKDLMQMMDRVAKNLSTSIENVVLDILFNEKPSEIKMAVERYYK